MIVSKTFLLSEELTVVMINEDPTVVRLLKPLVKTLQGRLETYATLEAFVAEGDPSRPGCLLLNVSSARCEGFAWLEQFLRLGIHLPVVILSTSGDVPVVVQAMRAGAHNFLQKPCTAADLREAVHDALSWDAAHRRQQADQLRVERRLARLTPGEYDVLRLLVDGRSNRQIATALGVSVRAVEVRRAKLMQKMKAESLADLVRFALTVFPEQLPAGREHQSPSPHPPTNPR